MALSSHTPAAAVGSCKGQVGSRRALLQDAQALLQAAPKEGIRYDGIYKVVKYYPEKGLSGYRVWKYLLRSDDSSPAPWEAGARQFPIIYPDGYLEAEAEKTSQKNKGRNKKRVLREKNDSTDESNTSTPPKKRKQDNKSYVKVSPEVCQTQLPASPLN